MLPQRDLADCVHMGYSSVYSEYILLEVQSGKLTDKRAFDHKEYKKFKERQFQAYKQTQAYREQVAMLKEEGDSQEFIDDFLRQYVVSYTSEFLDLDGEGPVDSATDN